MSSTTLITAVKGMPDILPEQIGLWQLLEEKLKHLMQQYGYQEIRMPILEKTQLFKRSIGDVTDIVEKEMYTFSDRDKQSTLLSLRPEATASCVRACLEHGLLRNQMQQKLWYLGPMFRRENPQKGRYRQFWQLGIEAFGFPNADIEVEHILMMHRLWGLLGLRDKVKLEINTLGTSLCRQQYRDNLVNYLQAHEHLLDDEAKRRLHSNPLRVLDSKNPKMQTMLQGAPKLEEYLSSDTAQHFEDFKAKLNALGITYEVNSRLVRGLDYYCHTIYEWTTEHLGAQSAICAGGRYDGLIEQLGGEASFGLGFALGLERVLLLLQQSDISVPSSVDGFLIAMGDNAEQQLLSIAEQLRTAAPTFRLQVNFSSGNLKKQFKKADKSGAQLALIIGDEELANQTVTIKHLRDDKPQEIVPIKTFDQFWGNR